MVEINVKEENNVFSPQEIHMIRDLTPPVDDEPFYSNYQVGVPIAMDFGSSSIRVGLTNSGEPNNVFSSVVSRYRDRKALKTLTLVGNDVLRDQSLKSSSKSPFDGTVVTNWDYVECIMDYSFEHLGVTSNNGSVNNPIIMTEPVACPLSQRKSMYELLFEAYQAPKVTFGIDSLFSYYANNKPDSSGLVIGTGHESTHVIPVWQGRGILSQTKRIDWGGNQSQQFLGKLLSLKYPYFPTKLTANNTANLFKDHSYVSLDYQDELSHYLDMDVLETEDVVVQIPVDISVSQDRKKTEEELVKQTEKRREQGKRLQEQAQQKRLEKLAQKQEEYEYYTTYKQDFSSLTPEDLQVKLEADGFDDLNDFNKYYTSLEKVIKKANNPNDEDEENINPLSAWPLVDIPDDQLTPDQIKEKRKQRLHKANYEAREKAKDLKRKEEEEKAKLEQEEKEWRERDLEDWCNVKRMALSDLIHQYKERVKLIESFKDRKSMAAQQRMKNIADLANDETGSTSATSRKRRRNANATIDNDPTDTFGANDDDWSIYRDISNASLKEEQEETNKQIVALENDLLQYDPNFHTEDTLAASQTFDWKNSALHKFIHGPRENIHIKMQAEGMDIDEIANHPEIIQKNHQMHLNIERIRVPEILFQPQMAGLDQAGITELSNDLLCRRLDGNFSVGGQSYEIVQNVFITGGLANLPNFIPRLTRDFTSFLPVGTRLNVRRAKNTLIDPWRGMQKWASSEECNNGYISKQEYEEYGAEYIKEHGLGNACLL